MATARGDDREAVDQELKKAAIEINEEKTKVVDFGSGASFGFLGFDFRAAHNRFGKRFVLGPQRQEAE